MNYIFSLLVAVSPSANVEGLRLLSENVHLIKNGLLPRELAKELGSRSPKLSKVLITLGCDPKWVGSLNSLLEGGATDVYTISSDPEGWYVEHQGHSSYYFSCQSGRNPRLDKRAGDLLDYQEGHLYFWVAGGRDLKERAKLRFAVYDGEPYIFVDRPYGSGALLTADIGRLDARVKSLGFKGLIMTYSWSALLKTGPDTQYLQDTRKLEMKVRGYADSPFTGKESLKDPTSDPFSEHECSGFWIYSGEQPKSLLKKGYLARRKDHGVYYYPVSKTSFDNANGRFSMHQPEINHLEPRDTEISALTRHEFGLLAAKVCAEVGYRPTSVKNHSSLLSLKWEDEDLETELWVGVDGKIHFSQFHTSGYWDRRFAEIHGRRQERLNKLFSEGKISQEGYQRMMNLFG